MAAALLQGIPAALAAQQDDSNQVEWVTPPPPPPVLPDAAREEVPARSQPQGITDPPIADLSVQGDPSDILKGLTEDPGARTEDTNVYKMNGADHLIEVFAGPVNYQNDKGEWVPISADLVPDGAGGLKNEANSFTTDFPAKLSVDTPVKITLPQGSFSFSLQGSPGAALDQRDDRTVEYAGVLDGVDLSYATIDEGYHEQVTLASLESATQPLAFDLSLQGLSLRQEKTGDISFLAGEDVVGTIPAPSAVDSSKDPDTGEPAQGAVSYLLTDLGGGSYTLALTVDPAFLDKATFPVVVDPSTLAPLNPSLDTYVDQASPDGHFGGATELKVGDPGSGTRYSFVEFDLHDQKRANRLVYQGVTELYATAVGSNPPDTV